MKTVDIMEMLTYAIDRTIFHDWRHEGFIGGFTSEDINFEVDGKEYVLKIHEVQDGEHWSMKGGAERMETLEYALECVVWYNGHYEWLETLADELEKATTIYSMPVELEWGTEKHCIWMLLIGMFGDWGTSIRGGWIEHTKECAEFIRNLCAKAKEGAE